MTSRGEFEGLRIAEAHIPVLEEVSLLLENEEDVKRRAIIENIAGKLVVASESFIMPDGDFENTSVFGDRPIFEKRYLKDLDIVENVVNVFKDQLGHKIVLTSGSFDISHLGHFRYIEKASEHGAILVVGVDSDEKIRERKGPKRPVVPESERLESLAHIRGVTFIVKKGVEQPRWELIKRVGPDVLIATEGTYSSEEVQELEEKYCGEVKVLPPQSTASTSARIRKLATDTSEEIGQRLTERVTETLSTTPVTELSEAMTETVEEVIKEYLQNI